MSDTPTDASKRTWLIASSCAGVVGAGFAAVPFVSSFAPSERAKAAGAPVEVDISNLKPDEKTHKSSAAFTYTVRKGDQQVMQFKETSEDMKQTGDQVTIERLLPLATLAPGKYTLEVSATDKLAQATISRSADFSIKNPAEQKAAANVTPGR